MLVKVNHKNSLLKYLEEISKIPFLTKEEEYNLAKQKDEGDLNAAKILISSHLRLVVKIASKYKNYGLQMSDLIAEGNLGLMKAVKEFSLEKGCRLSTYAMWWIKANIQEYILKSWSLVKIGTTLNQKKLFFNLQKVKHRILGYDKKFLGNDEIKKISYYLNVSDREVIELDKRLYSKDVSLNQKVYSNDDDSTRELGDMIKSKELPPDVQYELKQEKQQKMLLLKEAVDTLNDREKDIIMNRKLTDEPQTLQEFSKKYNISMERVRQIEEQAIKKLQSYVLLKINK